MTIELTSMDPMAKRVSNVLADYHVLVQNCDGLKKLIGPEGAVRLHAHLPVGNFGRGQYVPLTVREGDAKDVVMAEVRRREERIAKAEPLVAQITSAVEQLEALFGDVGETLPG